MSEKRIKAKKENYVRQDLGVLGLMGCLFAGTLIVANTPSNDKLEYILMLLITFCCMLFAAYRFTITAIVFAGLQITIYTAYKLFYYYRYGETVNFLDFVWILYPLLAIGAIVLFVERNVQLEIENELLRRQAQKLVLIDPLTGLYNLKGLYLDLKSQISLAGRKKIDISLMIITIRYEEELRKVLGKSNFNVLKQKIAAIVQDTIRIEDRLYSIDEKGSLAIILSCDTEGAEIVKRRIKEHLISSDGINNIITNKAIRVDLQFGYLQYDAAKFGADVIGFKQRTESELQYDV